MEGSARTARTHSANLAAWVLMVIVGVSVGFPALAVAWRVVRGVVSDGFAGVSLAPPIVTLAVSAAWAVGIGVLATVLAWPAAWMVRRRGWAIAPLLMTPLLLPSYLSYSGYGLLRAPRSLIGDWLEHLAQHGAPWAPIAAGRVIAVVGLAMWVWPLCAIVLGARVRRVDESVLDALRLEAMPWWRRGVELMWMVRGGVLASVGAAAVVMMGSSVPLHLAQVPTLAINVWFEMTLAPGNWRVWVSAWPLLVIAAIVGWGVGRIVAGGTADGDDNASGERDAEARDSRIGTVGRGRRWRIGAAEVGSALVWVLSVIVPLMLFATSIREMASLRRFWMLSGEAVANSVIVGVVVGVVGMLIAGCVWAGLSGSRRRATMLCVRALLFAGLVPGVLIGAAVAIAMNWTAITAELSESRMALVIGHTARLGCVGGLVGCWLAAIEPRTIRDLRMIDGALGWTGWWHACAPAHAGALVGAGLATGALSLHEIETSVVLQPPGVDSLAQTILGYLHFSRVEEMSAAAVFLVGGGVLAALIAAGAAAWTARRIA